MQANITLSISEVSEALKSYLSQNMIVPEEGIFTVELVPPKGTMQAQAVIYIDDSPSAVAVNSIPAITEEPLNIPAPATQVPPPEPMVEETGYAAMERAEILELCKKRNIPIRTEGASKDKRTTTLIKELEAWDDNGAPPPAEAVLPPNANNPFEDATVEAAFEAVEPETPLFDDPPIQEPAEEPGPAGHLFGEQAPIPDTEPEQVTEEAGIESLFG